MNENNQKKIGFFVTCLVESMRPQVAIASIKVLEEQGCEVFIPSKQTCCGQPGFNSGDDQAAKKFARNVIDTFYEFDYLVAPSGSCLGMIKTHYPDLFLDEPEYLEKARGLAARSYEILSFLTDVLDCKFDITFPYKTTYHDSCSGLRELDIRKQPRQLLASVKGLDLVELQDRDVCCGFGGTFCVKYPDISNSLVSDKVEDIESTGAEVLLAGDLGCLMNIAGRCTRLSKSVRCYHTIEVLAGMADRPGLGGDVLQGRKE